MRPSDTTEAAHRAQLEVYRRIGRDARLALALHMSDELQQIAADGVRLRHPSYDEASTWAALVRLRIGTDVFLAAYPGRPLVPP